MAGHPFVFESPKIDFHAVDIITEWEDFKDHCELIFNGSLHAQTEKVKANTLRQFLGAEGRRIFKTFVFDADAGESADTRADIYKKYEDYIAPKANHRSARLLLQRIRQSETEGIDDFINRLRLHARHCRFKDNAETEERVIEQLIAGTKHKEVQRKLISKDTLTLDEAVKVARSYEAVQGHLSDIRENEKSVGAVSKSSSTCGNCGEPRHKSMSECRAKGTQCRKCGKIGHWKKVCRSQKKKADHNPQAQRGRGGGLRCLSRGRGRSRGRGGGRNRGGGRGRGNIHDVEEYQYDQYDDLDDKFESLNLDFDSVTIDSVHNNDNRDKVFAKIGIDVARGATLKVKVDTGAEANLLPVRIYRNMYPDKVDDRGIPLPEHTIYSDKILRGYGGHPLKHFGKCSIRSSYNSRQENTKFFITEEDGPALLGCQSSQALGLVKVCCHVSAPPPPSKPPEPPLTPASPPTRPVPTPQPSTKHISTSEQLIAEYPDRFKGLGKFKGEHHIVLDPSVPPRVHPPRKTPIHMRDKIKVELDEMEQLKVIAKVGDAEPTQWVNSMVWQHKPNGRLRPCLDPKDLNEAIRRAHHPTPTLEEITHKLAHAKVFSTLDAKYGYWSVVLDEESSYLTTFNTMHPFGRYRFLRLPFGLKSSQDIFQIKMDQILEACPGTISIADDITVFGKDDDEHDRNLRNLMEQARIHGLVFNPSKLKIKQKRIKFYGVVFDEDGVHSDPDKVKDLMSIPPPADKAALGQFLGICTYMSPFVANMSAHTEPLRALMKSDVPFEWNASHTATFQQIKQLICDHRTLAYYDPTKPLTMQVDASLKGLGCCLLQDEKPVAFGSKALKGPETRYNNIEREMLAVVYGCERFHTYIYARHVLVESDHKPLQSIKLKHLSQAPARLQRMLLKIQPYNLKIVHKPGKDMLLADAMSRLSPSPGDVISGLDVNVLNVNLGDPLKDELRQETAKNPDLNALKEIIYNGWPQRKQQVPAPLQKYWNYRDELAVDDGIIVKGERYIVPESLQAACLKRLHYGHLGVTKSISRAKSTVYWENIDKDIEKTVRECPICQENKGSQPPETLMPHDVPTGPWKILGSDLFFLNQKEYLILADFYSKFPFLRKMAHGQSTSATVIKFLKQIFGEIGTPRRLYTDGGPHYSSEKFKQFAQEWGFEHIMSSPHFPQSNGFIERAVQTAKSVIRKAEQEGSDPELALQVLRTTPVDHKIPSPAELLHGRKMQSNLPVKIHHSNDPVTQQLQHRQDSMKHYHDRKARDLPPLYPEQQIRVLDQKSKKWVPATVSRVRPEPRSYDIVTRDGVTLRRNRRHLRSTAEPRIAPNEPFDDELDAPSIPQRPAGVPAAAPSQARPAHRPTAAEPPPLRRSTRATTAPKRLIEEM